MEELKITYTRVFLQEAKFIRKEQQDAVLKLAILTGLPDQIDVIANYIKLQNGKTFTGSLLRELKGKTVAEKSAYLKEHTLEEIFSFVGMEITQDEFNKILVGFTQINWFGRSGERWNGIEIQKKLAEFDTYTEIHEQLAQTTISRDPEHRGRIVAILGATIKTMESRLRYADRLDLSTKEVYFLVGKRSLNPEEKQIPELLDNVKRICAERNLPIPETLDQLTETHGAMFLVDKINKERAGKGQQAINANFVDTLACLNFENTTLGRPNTEATVRQFLIDTLDREININDVIFVSNGINVEAQQIAIERVLAENGFSCHTAIVDGEAPAATTKFSAASGSMAGRLYGAFSRCRYGTPNKLESKMKESFRDRALSYTQGGLKQILQ